MNPLVRALVYAGVLLNLSISFSFGQGKPSEEFVIVCYNVENLFDPRNDPEKNDEEFTPSGKNHWTISKLNKKVMMVYRAILAASNGVYPDIIGLEEIENLWVLEYLLKKTPFSQAGYGIIHKESPDPRGIDVALLYRKARMVPLDFDFYPVHGQNNLTFISRDILHFQAELKGEKFHFFVNHWPSRSGGYAETMGKRNHTATIVRQVIDSIQAGNPQSKILLMGDFNATPDEDCFIKILRASTTRNSNKSMQLINLAQFWQKSGTGTIRSQGQWEIFDQFICTNNLLQNDGLTIDTEKTSICQAGFLLENDARYLGKKPFRTNLGPVYHGGVSDHLPISTVLRKKVTKVN